MQYIVNIIARDDLYQKMGEKSLEFAREHDIFKTLESFEKLYRVCRL
jgi:hypothetical protein